MFSLAPTAATVMIDARDEVGVPSDRGIRFVVPSDGSTGITFDFVAAPEPDDVLGGSGKLRTSVEAAVHREIGDATVDFVDTDGTTELVIKPHRDVRHQ